VFAEPAWRVLRGAYRPAHTDRHVRRGDPGVTTLDGSNAGFQNPALQPAISQ
jgi:hypothetical protein